MSLLKKGLALLKSEPEKPITTKPTDQYMEDLKKYVKEHQDDKGFPPKSDVLANASIDALNK